MYSNLEFPNTISSLLPWDPNIVTHMLRNLYNQIEKQVTKDIKKIIIPSYPFFCPRRQEWVVWRGNFVALTGLLRAYFWLLFCTQTFSFPNTYKHHADLFWFSGRCGSNTLLLPMSVFFGTYSTWAESYWCSYFIW